MLLSSYSAAEYHRLRSSCLTLLKQKSTVAVKDESEDAEVDENVGGDVGGKSKTPEQHLQRRNEPPTHIGAAAVAVEAVTIDYAEPSK